MIDAKQLAAGILEVVKAWVEPAFVLVRGRLDDLDTRVKALPAGPPGAQGAAGKDGAAGINGKDADAAVIALLIATEVAAQLAKVPKAKDGEPGRDGRDGLPGLPGRNGDPGLNGKDGFSLDDLDVSLADDGRTLQVKFNREGYPPGEGVFARHIKLATMLYRGVWREGEFERGDVVTWDGSSWHCQAKTSDKPGPSGAWQMMVRKGDRGKDAAASTPAASHVVRVK